MDGITPVGAMVNPPSPTQGLSSLSSILGIQQQAQNLQTGAFRQQEVQAGAQQAQQENAEKQGLATFTRNAVHDPRYQNADGSLNVTKFQRDASSIAPVYGQAYIGQATSNANGAIESRKALLGLNKEQLATSGNFFAAVAAKPGATTEDLLNAAEQARGVSDDPQYQKHIDRMLMSMPQVGSMPSDQASLAVRQHARLIGLGTSAAVTGQSDPNISTVNTLGGVQPIQTNPQSPLGSGPTAKPIPGSSLPAIAGATSTATGTATDDNARNAQISSSVAPSRASITLADQISKLADEVHTGKYSKEVTDLAATLAQHNPELAARQLMSKYSAQLQTQAIANAPSDNSRSVIEAGFPDPQTMGPEAIKKASEYIKGSMLMNLSRAANARQFQATHGNTQGLRLADDQFTSQADPLMYTYQNLPKGQERTDFIRRHFNTQQDAADFVRRKNAVEHYGGFNQ